MDNNMVIDEESVPVVKEGIDFLKADMELIQIENAYQLKVYLPGMEMNDVTISIEEDKVLKISRELKIDTALKWLLGEQISRSFRFPKAVELNELKTWMEDGVLSVSVTLKKRKNVAMSKLQALMAKALPACVFIGGNLIDDIAVDDE